MTCNRFSDFPIAYHPPYRSLTKAERPPKELFEEILKSRTKLAYLLASNCKSQRERLFEEIEQLMPLDRFGYCYDKNCQKDSHERCLIAEDRLLQFYFYLAFENTRCRDYITEKLYWNGFNHYAVPVVWGARRDDYERILPPGSFIFADDFTSTENLTNYLQKLTEDHSNYMEFHRWRETFKVSTWADRDFGPSYPFCQLCQFVAQQHYSQNRTSFTPTFERFRLAVSDDTCLKRPLEDRWQ